MRNLSAAVVLIAACSRNASVGALQGPADSGAQGSGSVVEAMPDAGPHPSTCSGCALIRHVRVIDADGVRLDRRVAIQGGTIVAEEPDIGDFTGAARERDGRERTLLPGLWDMHVHLPASAGGGYTPPNIGAHLMAYLSSGVTSIVDLGSSRGTILSLRDRIRSKGLLAPHLRAVGPLFTAPGGHPCIQSYDPEACGLIADEASAQGLVDALAPLGPDLVKVVIEGGIPPLRRLPRVTAREVSALVAASRAHQLRVIAHVSTTEDVKDAIGSGVAALAHISVTELLPDEVIALLASGRIPVVTTIAAYEATGHYLDDPAYLDDPLVQRTVEPAVLTTLRDPNLRAIYEGPSSIFVADFRVYAETAARNLMRLKAAGVPILAGSDAGNFLVFHGPALHRELSLMVRAGMTPVEAIAAATLAPAQFFGVDGTIGKVKADFQADLLMVNGDPSADITATQRIEAVWLEGRGLDLSAFDPAAPPHALVQAAAGGAEGSSCVEDTDCTERLGCDTLSWLCRRTCSLADRGACGNEACLSNGIGGYCYRSSGCDPLRQDCPFNEVYNATCTPVEAHYTYCAPSGIRQQGERCDYSVNLCAPGLYCGLGNQCYALCDPHGTALPPCTQGQRCADLTAQWGHPVGLCVR